MRIVWNTRLVLAAALMVLMASPARAPAVAGQPPECGAVERGQIAHGQTVTGRIDDCRVEEVWTFEGVRGQAVVIEMEVPSPPTFGGLEMDPFLRLFAPSAEGRTTLAAENDDGGIGFNARIEHRLNATGRYRIVATSVGDSFGDYQLTLRFRGMSATERGEIRPDQSVTGRVDVQNPEDAWTFEGTRGQRVLISMEITRPVSLDSILLDPLLFLFAPEENGVSLIEDTDDDGGAEFDALIVRRLDRTGTYRIIATSVGQSFGQYRLTLRVEGTGP